MAAACHLEGSRRLQHLREHGLEGECPSRGFAIFSNFVLDELVNIPELQGEMGMLEPYRFNRRIYGKH